MKKLIKDRKSRLHVYLIRPLVILMCWSLALSPVSANVAFEIADDGSGGGGGGGGGSIYPVTAEEAQDALSQIQAKQNAYFNAHGKYFVSDSISQINNALGLIFSEAYWDIKTGDSVDLLGQIDAKDSDLGFRIKKTGQPYCFMGETSPPASKGKGGSSILADVNLTTGGEVHSSPVMVNLDGEPKGELIVGSNDGKVYAWKHDGVSWTGFLSSDGVFAETDGTAIRSTPAVADIDNDGIKEVVVGTLNANVYVFKAQDVAPLDNRADLLFQKTLADNIENSIVLEDIDGDTFDEIIALSNFGTFGIWNHDGTAYATVPPNPFGIVYGTPAVADLDNNGDKEIVVGRVSTIYAWNHDGTGFRNANGSFSTVTGEIHSSPALADIDGDGFLEIIVATWQGTTGYLYAFNHDATAVEPLPPGTTSSWPKNVGSNIKSSPSVADMTIHSNAGYPQYSQDLEMVVGFTNGKVHAYHHDGTVVTGWPIVTNRNMGATAYDNDSSAAIADIDDDGDKEVVIGSWGGKLYAYHHNGTTVAGWPKPADPDNMGPIELSAPSIGILAGAPYLDAAIGSIDGTVYLWELSGQSAAGRLPWPKFRHDLKNTGTYLRADRGIPTLNPVSNVNVGVGQPVNFTVQGNDTGTAPLNVTDISAFNLPSGATFTFNDALDRGSFSWPSAVPGGPYTVTFIATDYYGLHSAKLNVVITVTVNNPPVANDDGYFLNEDTTKIVAAPGVLGNDSDPDGNPITADRTGGAGPNHGTLTAFGTNGSFTYVPNPNYNGVDTFTYRAYDGSLYSNRYAIVTLIVSPVPDAPVAVNDPATTAEDQAVDIYVLANDFDYDGEDFAINTFTQPAHGIVTRNGDVLRYTPTLNYDLTDSFTYNIIDTTSRVSNNATVSITINPSPDNPIAVNDTDSTNEDTYKDIAVMANDYDPDTGDTISLNNIVSGPSHGTAFINGSNIRYSPTANWSGSDSFTYNIKDSTDRISNTATVSVTIVAIPDNPVAVNDSDSTPQGVAKDVAVLTNDYDPDTGDTVTINSVVSQPSHGTAAINGNFIRYTPEPAYAGPTDSFTYNIIDTTLRISNTATVTITISVSVAPVLANIELSALPYTENQAATAITSTITVSDADSANMQTGQVWISGSYQNGQDVLSYTQVGSIVGAWSAATGTMSLSGNDTKANYQLALRAVKYSNSSENPNTSQRTVSFKVNDGTADSNIATRNINVTAVNDAPIAVNDSYSTPINTDLVVPPPGVLSNDTDAEGTALTANRTGATDPTHGTIVAFGANGSFTYRPTSGYVGADSFTYRAYDGALYSGYAAVNISISNTAPTLAGIPDISTPEDTPLNNAVDLYTYAADAETADSGLTFTIQSNSQPSAGISIDTNRYIDVNPAANWFGYSDVTIRVTDPGGLFAQDTFRVTVAQRCDDAPTAAADTYSTNEDTVLNQAAPGVLSNDTNNESGTTMTAVKVTDPTNGTVTLNPNGSFIYTPAANWFGSTSFIYKARSSGGVCTTPIDSANTTVTITVNQLCDDAPTAVNDTYPAVESTTLTIPAFSGVMINDINPEAPGYGFGSVSLVVGSGPSHGILSLATNGGFTYTPTTGYIGSDSFRYKFSICNPALLSNEATVTINVASCGRVRLYNASGNFVQCYNNIQDAVNASNTNYRIKADPGIYNERLTFNINKAITVESTSGNATDTIISGQSLGTVVNFMPAAATAAITFKGFGVAYGLTSGNGGGIIINNAPVNIVNCDITDNNANGATSKGGGIYINSDKSTSISGTEIYRNRATDTLSDAVYVSGTGVTSFVGTNIIRHSTGGGGGCLLPGTKIAMADGTLKTIENVLTGDKVFGVTPDGKTVATDVTQTFVHPQMKGYFIIETEDGKALNVTAIHPIYNGKEFVEASTLKVGDDIMVTDNKDSSQLALKKIAKIEKKDSVVDVYNLEVEPHHTYIAEGVVVHNKAQNMMSDGTSPSGPY